MLQASKSSEVERCYKNYATVNWNANAVVVVVVVVVVVLSIVRLLDVLHLQSCFPIYLGYIHQVRWWSIFIFDKNFTL